MSAILFSGKGTVINVGYNRRIINFRKPTQVFRRGIPYVSVHAEIDCLAGLNFYETIGNYMYVHRRGGNLAKPCEKCDHVLRQFGLKKIFWSDGL